VYHLLSLLESDAAGVVATRPARRAVRTAGPARRAGSRRQAANREKFFAINERFHMRLLEIADNRWRARWWPTCAR
jgi:DNA-binding GntR family transcriptional regulator